MPTAVKELWTKWSWLVCLVLLAYGAYLTFTPKEVKVVTKTVVDESIKTQLDEQKSINKNLQRKLEKATQTNIDVDEVITETVKPDGTIIRTITRKTKDTSTSTTTDNRSSSEVTTSSKTATTDSKTHTDTTTTTTTDTRRFSAGAGYFIFQGAPGVMVQYNFFKNIGTMAVLNPRDIGAFVVIRF